MKANIITLDKLPTVEKIKNRKKEKIYFEVSGAKIQALLDNNRR